MSLPYTARVRARRSASLVFALATTAFAAAAPAVRFTSYTDVRSLIDRRPDLLPLELARANERDRAARWPAWIARHDREIRERLARGDEDTLVNWLLFGTSFTSQPPAVVDTAGANDSAAVSRL